jgi:hypothetical protein
LLFPCIFVRCHGHHWSVWPWRAGCLVAFTTVDMQENVDTARWVEK